MTRPDQVLLVALVYGTGVLAAAAMHGPVPPAQAWWGLAALLPTAASVHLVNEWADAETDALTRRTRFSGGSGALSDSGLDRRLALRSAVVFAAVSLGIAALGALGGALSAVAVTLLVLGMVGGWQYSVGPLALSRHGWGEVTNAALGGLLLPAYGAAVATGSVSADAVAVFVPFALLTFVNLLETQWADRDADRRTGVATLVTRLTARGVRLLAFGATVLAYTVVAALAPDPLPTPVAVASLAAVPLSAWAVLTITRRSTPLPAVLGMVVLLLAQAAAWAAMWAWG